MDDRGNMGRGAAPRASAVVARLRESWALSWAAVAWIGSSAILLVGLAAMFGKLTEDVVARNGWEVGDLSEVEQVAGHRDAALVSTALLFTRLGSVPVLLMIAVTAAAVLWWRGQRLFLALAPLAALLCAGAATAVGKHLVDRARPPVWLHLVAEEDASFPSGHSGDSAALFLTLGVIAAAAICTSWRTRTAVAGVSVLLVAGVASSRVALGVHYPTDVLAGLDIGSSIALLVGVAALVVQMRLDSLPPAGRAARQLDGVKGRLARSRQQPSARSSTAWAGAGGLHH